MLSRATKTPAPGGGNRTPLPPRQFGGGGNGGGSSGGGGDESQAFRNRLDRYRLGLVFTAISILVLFISITTLFVARRAATHYSSFNPGAQSDWVPVALPVKILLINTVVLGASSLLLEKGRRAARMEAVLAPMGKIPGVRTPRQTSLLWVAASALAGVAFLCGQLYAWHSLHLHGISMASGPAGIFFFLLTGGHALHLAAGVVILLYACLAPGPRHSMERRSITLDVTTWYWHFMAVLWLYVLLVLKLMN
jgi:cytochrome c oxidase subunit 3